MPSLRVSPLSRPFTRALRPSTAIIRRTIQRRFISTPRDTFTSDRTATIVLRTVIGTCASVFAFTRFAESTAKETGNTGPRQRVYDHLVLSAHNVREGRYWTILTHTLTHFTVPHLVFNMLGLWTFGKPVIILYGVRGFLALWVGAGISGGVASLMVEKGNNAAAEKGTLGRWGRKKEGETKYVGASSSISGIGAAFAAAYPKGTMMIFPIPFPMYNWVAFVGFAAYSVYAQTSGLQGNVGHLGHLGGLAFGAIYWLVRLRRSF